MASDGDRTTPAPAAAPRLGRNPVLLCVFHAFNMSLFPIAVITLFFKHEIGMSATEIMVLQALFGATTALFEFPTGYVADRMGYRLALMLASAGALVGWAVYCVATDFWSCLLAEVVLALAFSLLSGADTALLYESLLESGREEEFSRWFGRFRSAGQAAEGTAALLAGLLYARWVRLPFVLELFVWGANFVVAWLLVEPARPAPDGGGHWQKVRALVRYAAVGSPRLRAVIFLGVCLILTSFVPVWLIQLYAREAGVPLAWLGPIWAAANYSVAIFSLASTRLSRRLGLAPLLLLCIGLAAVGYAGLGLSHGLFGFAFYFVITAMRGLNVPPLHHEEQRLLPSSDRAGLVSLRNLLFRGSFALIGPLVGVGVDRVGMHPVLLVAGAALSAASLTGWVWLRRTPPAASGAPFRAAGGPG